MRAVLLNIGGWYFCSVSLSLYNKMMFDPAQGFDVGYPILVTAFHQWTLYVVSTVFIKWSQSRGRYGLRSGATNWGYFFRYIVPTAIASAGDIGISNLSFQFVPLTIYTVIKSASIVFVLFFGCLFGLEQYHWKLSVITVGMFVGVLLMVYHPNTGTSVKASETQDSETILFGAFLVLASSFLSGLRWVYTQMILRHLSAKHYVGTQTGFPEDGTSLRLKRSHRKPHPILTINQISPIMSGLLLITSLLVENPFPDIFHSQLFKISSPTKEENLITPISVLKGAVLLVVPGIEVFFMTLCEFNILQISQVLTLSIAGIAKEVLTILFGILVFKEHINGLQSWLGIVTILMVVSYYNYFRYSQDNSYQTTYQDQENQSSPPSSGHNWNVLMPYKTPNSPLPSGPPFEDDSVKKRTPLSFPSPNKNHV